jgi:hypothetical protein
MEIKPVGIAVYPQYPKREGISSEQIKDSVPQRWAGSHAAKIALGALAAMSLAGCTPPRTAGVPIAPSPTTEEMVSQSPVVDDVLMGEVMAPTISVAPLFEHGDGMGAFGCDMVTPPVFLTEDEALSVINNVAKEYGLTFSAKGAPALANVLQPVTNIYEPEEKAAPDTVVTLTPDFADAAHGVVLEFVSVEDVRSWHKDQGFASSVESYDALDAAEQLSEALESAAADTGGCTVGVLYDPCEQQDPQNGGDWEAAVRDAEAQSRARSEAALAAQVRDFLEWLKAQGVI